MDCEYNMAGAHFDALPGCMQEASPVLPAPRDLVAGAGASMISVDRRQANAHE
jgi:hypothetical protein